MKLLLSSLVPLALLSCALEAAARTPWVNACLAGTPEPPPPYVAVRAYPQLAMKRPVALELKLPPGIEAEPKVLEGSVAAKSRQVFPVKLTVKDRAGISAGVQIVPFDISLDGELFDFIVLGRTATP